MGRNGMHVIVVCNEKGGSGKSTTAFHLAIYLAYQGARVATIDADSRQQTFTHYLRNRRSWAEQHEMTVPLPRHVHLPAAWGDSIRENQKAEADLFDRTIERLRDGTDFLLIDTPGFDTNLTRLAHGVADTLVTPVNDSLIDLDVLARVDSNVAAPIEASPYTRLVQRVRADRHARSGETIDWVLVRNRISNLGSRNAQQVQDTLDRVARTFECRVAEGIAERVIFRSLFPTGMTVFDPLEESRLGTGPSISHVNARQEYRSLVAALRLPLGEAGAMVERRPEAPIRLSA